MRKCKNYIWKKREQNLCIFAYHVGQRPISLLTGLQRCTVERDGLMPCVYPSTPLLCDGLRGSWREWRQNNSRGGNQRGQTPLQVPSLPSSSTDRKKTTECPPGEFTASPVQPLQSNQFNPSRGHSSPACPFQKIPSYLQKKSLPNLFQISKVWHNHFNRRWPSNSDASPAGRRDDLRRPPD